MVIRWLGSNYTQTDITVYPSNFNAGWGLGFNGWGNPYFNNGFGWNNPLLRRIRMEQCFYGNGFGWGYPFGWIWGFGYRGFGLVDLAMEASDGIILTTATITFMVSRI
jgi:hypothetical protein